MFDGLRQDTKYAVRALARNPGFSAVTIAILALGLGANVGVFTLVRSVVLRALPYPAAERLVTLWSASRGGHSFGLTEAEYIDFRSRNRSFTELAAHQIDEWNLSAGGEASRVEGAWATPSLAATMQMPPALGRFFTDAEALSGTERVVVISHGLWVERFGSDRSVIGSTVVLGGQPATVVGVMPAEFRFPRSSTRLWVPMPVPATPSIHDRSLSVIARLEPGTSLAVALADANRLAAELAKEYTARYGTEVNLLNAANLIPLHDDVVGDSRLALLVIWGAVSVVLLIACANVAGLLLVRADSRQKVIAVRLALGATSRRIFAQSLIESGVLVASATGVGIIIALWCVRLLRTTAGNAITAGRPIEIDAGVLGFAFLLAALTTVLAGSAPAFHGRTVDLLSLLKTNSRGSTGARGTALRTGLVIGEIALAVVLLIGAGLLVRTFTSINQVDPGFRAEGVLTMRVSLPYSQYTDAARVQQYYASALARLSALPGVTSAGAAHALPLDGRYSNASLEIDGRNPATGSFIAEYRVITPGYTETMGIRQLRGRTFNAADQRLPVGAVIISRAMAEGFWQDADPIGSQMRLRSDQPWMTVVGIVDDVHHVGLTSAPGPAMYLPHATLPFGAGWTAHDMSIVLRTSATAAALRPSIRAELQRIDPSIPAADIRSMGEIMRGARTQITTTTTLLGVFAALAVTLAALGLYGVMAYIVAGRSREIGIRMALGATAAGVTAGIISHALRLAVIGVLIGIGGAVGMSRLVRTMLFGVGSLDPLTYALAASLLVATAALAAYLPARRASRIDPLSALRHE